MHSFCLIKRQRWNGIFLSKVKAFLLRMQVGQGIANPDLPMPCFSAQFCMGSEVYWGFIGIDISIWVMHSVKLSHVNKVVSTWFPCGIAPIKILSCPKYHSDSSSNFLFIAFRRCTLFLPFVIFIIITAVLIKRITLPLRLYALGRKNVRRERKRKEGCTW